MKSLAFMTFVLVLFPVLLFSQNDVQFSQYFKDATMRIDYYHIGDAKYQTITVDKVYQQGIWAGSQKNLIDNFNNGRYYVKIYDAASGKLIYSKGFDSYFGEYQTSEPASKGIQRTYQESALIPYPKSTIRFTIERRDKANKLQPLFSQEIDPNSVDVIREPLGKGVTVIEEVKNGDPHVKADIAFIAEGYTAEQEGKFRKDLKRFTEVFFNQEPYKSMKSDFNIYGVFKPSAESGTDEPTHGSYKNTTLNTTFNSLGSERYLLTEDNKSLRDVAAHVPYDALVIMVNSSRYGGGGIYNLYCTFTADNQWCNYLLLHEFGHSFSGLADEYYTSDVAYNEFYPQGIEPVEPNITALLNAPHVKWDSLTTPGIAIPTPWEKADFDSMDLKYQKIRRELNNKIAKMKREGAPEKEVKTLEEKSEKLSRENAQKVDDYLKHSKYWGKVGAFEGAGYASTGLYRSMLDCIMFSKGAKPYCTVCEHAVENVIRHYTE